MRSSVCVHRAAPIADKASVVVTCVHGTWARGSRWPLLENTVATALGVSAPITIQYFEWSGRNSVSARTQAAADLRHLLFEQVTRTPYARHVLVAHSHGANIVLHALAGGGEGTRTIRNALAGIVFLSPPLLDCEVVEEPDAAANRLLAAALAVVPLLIPAAPYVRPTFGFGDLPGIVGFLILVGAWLMLFRPTVVKRHAESLARQLALPRLEFPGLVVRAARDEATFTLSSVTAFARMARRIWSRVLRVRIPLQSEQEQELREARKFGERAFAVWAMASLVVVAMNLISGTREMAASGNWGVFAMMLPASIVSATVAGVIVGGSVVLLMLIPAFSLLLWPCGIFPTPAAALLSVSVKSVPAPGWQVVHCEEHVTGWGHSVHEHEAALECINTYLRGVLERS